jgi:hypothetical protein
LKKQLLAAAAAALAVPAVALAAPAQDKVTGGGQTLVPSGGGPGTTIAFTAQGTGGIARGQLQYNDHAGDKVHGTVDCLRVASRTDDGGMAVFGGTLREDRDGNGEPDRFRVTVTDGGEGMGTTDMIAFERVDDDVRCEEQDDEFENLPILARGNVQVHKAKG